jgi:hypothetical protein
MVLRRKLEPNREQVKCLKNFMRSFMEFNVQQIFSVLKVRMELVKLTGKKRTAYRISIGKPERKYTWMS